MAGSARPLDAARWLRAALAALVLAGASTRAARAADAPVPVDLELVLAVDVSASVDDDEFNLQMRGLAAAFRHPDVLAAIEAGGGPGVAVAVVQWSDVDEQALAVDWQLVHDQASAAAFAQDIRTAPRFIAGGQTAIGDAIAFSIRQIAGNNFDGSRKVIDISGDGRANAGGDPYYARQLAFDQGVTVNGIAIVNEEPFVDNYFQENVISGTGAFLLKAQDYEDFAAAILDKLVREIGPPLAREDGPARRFAARPAAGLVL